MSHSPQPVTRELPAQYIVDVIGYTASLSSSVAAIDSFLDTLRRITASRDLSEFSPEDIEKLHDLQQQLEAHLVTKEKIRAFDYELLHLHIKKRFLESKSYRRLPWTLACIVGTGLALGVAVLLAPLPSLSPITTAYAALTVLYAVLYVGAGWLFLSVAKELTASARTAYKFISLAIILRGVFVLLQPLMVLFGLDQHPFAPTAIDLPLIIAYIIFYLGAEKVLRLSNNSTALVARRTTAIILVTFIILATILTSIVSPWVENALPIGYTISATIAQGISTILLCIIAYHLAQARKGQSSLYSRATFALLIGVTVNALHKGFFTLYWMFGGGLSPNIWLAIGLAILFVTAVLYVRAGYIFNKIHHY